MLRHWLALLFAASPLAAGANPDFAVLQGLMSSLVKVEAVNPDGSVSIGTGVLVAPGIVATNCHVTQRARSIQVTKGDHFPVESQHADVERDLCLLAAPHVENVPVARLRDEPLRIGEEVYAIGFIFGVSPRFNTGEVNALHDYAGGKVIQSTTPFTSGASGGGLFDREGRLAGIVTFKYRSGASYHFSLPVAWVADAARNFRGVPVRPVEGTPFWQKPRDAQPYFLRASSLEAESNWRALADLAGQWSEAEPRNSSSWFALGQAHQHLKQHDQSIDAFKRAIALDPRFLRAWYQLGLAYAGSGDAEQVEQVYRVLEDLDLRLADDYAQAARACNDTPNTIC